MSTFLSTEQKCFIKYGFFCIVHLATEYHGSDSFCATHLKHRSLVSTPCPGISPSVLSHTFSCVLCFLASSWLLSTSLFPKYCCFSFVSVPVLSSPGLPFLQAEAHSARDKIWSPCFQLSPLLPHWSSFISFNWPLLLALWNWTF